MKWPVAIAVALISWVMLIGVPSAQPPVTAIAFSKDGQSLVACSQAGIEVHGWPELQLQLTLDGEFVQPHDVAFSPSGRVLAVAGGAPADEGKLALQSWPSGARLCSVAAGDDSLMSIVWLSESKLAVASLDRTIRLIEFDSDFRAARTTKILQGHSRGVTALCVIQPNESVKQQTAAELLISGGVDQSLRVWEGGNSELLRSMSQHTQPVNSLATRPTTAGLPMIASASSDRTVRLWQPTIGRMVRFARLSSTPLAVQWSADGTKLVACCMDGNVILIDPDTVTILAELPGIQGPAFCLAVHPTDGNLAVAGKNGIARVELP